MRWSAAVRWALAVIAVVAVVATFVASDDVTVRMTMCMGVGAGLIIWGIAELILRTGGGKRAAQ
jgi:uncharacterized membrane protein YoaT (DUF817 family)